MEFKETFSKNLRTELKFRNISQSELARKIGVKQSSVCEWCKGDSFPALETFYKICKTLNASADIMLELDEVNTEAAENWLFEKLAIVADESLHN